MNVGVLVPYHEVGDGSGRLLCGGFDGVGCEDLGGQGRGCDCVLDGRLVDVRLGGAVSGDLDGRYGLFLPAECVAVREESVIAGHMMHTMDVESGGK